MNKTYIDQLKCNPRDLIKDVLVQLNKSKKKFLICVNDSEVVIGIVTDGDIRRAFLNDVTILDTIDKAYNTKFKFLYDTSDFSKVCELFGSVKLDFLPILDKSMVLINVLTKKQFHLSLLEDIDFSLNFDFSQLDDITLDHEVFDRPWGFYKSTFLTMHAQAKIITILPYSELSLQKHQKREEHWLIIKGSGTAILDEKVIDVYPGKYLYVPKDIKHQIINSSDKNLIFSEVQLGEYFGEDDIIRYSDKYGRELQGDK